jgi:hypothetical protein
MNAKNIQFLVQNGSSYTNNYDQNFKKNFLIYGLTNEIIY